MTDTTYNGWASYETWAANLELCEDICRMWEEDKQTFDSVYDLSEALKTYVWELFEETDSQIGHKEASVLYTWAMRSLENVNWYEIAEHYPDLIASEEEGDLASED